MGSCCKLTDAVNGERILCRTDNFFVMPTLGPIGVEGYLLIIPNKHHLGMGAVPDSLYPELNELINDTKKIIWSEYRKPSLIFEHGPRVGELSSGASIDHAHLHVVPGVDITKEWAVDLMMRLGDTGKFYRVERVEGFGKAKELLENKKSYLYLENILGVQLMSEQNFNRPSQYFRKMVADNVCSLNWNYKRHPDYRTLERTIKKLKGKF